MIPLTDNPTVFVLADKQNNIVQIATNIDPLLKVVITQDSGEFDDETRGMPFNAINTNTSTHINR